MRSQWFRASLRFLLLLIITSSAQADILAGRIFSVGTEPTVISAFGDSASGNVAPMNWLGGSNTNITSANGITFDPIENTLLVADFYGQKIVVFAVNARGDIAPLRSFNSPALGQVRKIIPITAHGEYVTLNFYSLQYFSQSATGTVSALRGTSYQPNLINNAGGLIYLEATDEVAIGDYADLAPSQTEGEVLFFARSDSGAVTPTRRIAGPSTQLGQYVYNLAYDAVHGEIHVLCSSNVAGVPIDKIVTFSASAQGDASPLRVIAGAATGLTASTSLALYEFRDELLVTTESYGGAGTPSIIGFARTANGNVAPTRRIGGSNSGVPNSDGWYSVVGVPLELIFRNSFEP